MGGGEGVPECPANGLILMVGGKIGVGVEDSSGQLHDEGFGEVGRLGVGTVEGAGQVLNAARVTSRHVVVHPLDLQGGGRNQGVVPNAEILVKPRLQNCMALRTPLYRN